MKILCVNYSYSFGRTPLMTCTVKQKEKNEKVSATLYKMDPKNPKDIDDVRYSKKGRYMYGDMLQESKQKQSAREFFMLQNDKTQEVISCAQISHRYRPSQKNQGFYSLIEEMNISNNYINGAEPIIAYLAYNAQNRLESSLYSAFHPEEIPIDMKRIKFSEGNKGEWYLPQRRFNTLIDRAQAHSQIEFML